ncbi:hypothetical protein CI610_03309 [invertebrate metagenome]|uniref:Uncharacterized protein n=1 Tax=invertebrate metagenome TaxID=1711999 RepID=A0A2H9T3F8_9ZZZZ
MSQHLHIQHFALTATLTNHILHLDQNATCRVISGAKTKLDGYAEKDKRHSFNAGGYNVKLLVK